MRLESIIQLIQSMPSGKSVQRSARMLGVFALIDCESQWICRCRG